MVSIKNTAMGKKRAAIFRNISDEDDYNATETLRPGTTNSACGHFQWIGLYKQIWAH